MSSIGSNNAYNSIHQPADQQRMHDFNEGHHGKDATWKEAFTKGKTSKNDWRDAWSPRAHHDKVHNEHQRENKTGDETKANKGTVDSEQSADANLTSADTADYNADISGLTGSANQGQLLYIQQQYQSYLAAGGGTGSDVDGGESFNDFLTAQEGTPPSE